MSKNTRTLKDLNLIDNFLFNEMLLQQNQSDVEQFMKVTLEPILQRRIGKISVNGQMIIQGVDTNKRGVQLDAFIKEYTDENGENLADVTVSEKPIYYNVEPNTKKTDDCRRARLYHSKIDSYTIDSGTRFKDISDVFVIFILPYDPFGFDSMVYTARTRLIEYLDYDYQDGATTLFLYTNGKKNIPSQELKNMLEFYVSSTEDNARKANAMELYNMISKAKSNKAIEEKFMWQWEREDLIRDEALAEGEAIGRAEGENNAIIKLFLKKQIDIATATENTGMTSEDFFKMVDEYREKNQ